MKFPAAHPGSDVEIEGIRRQQDVVSLTLALNGEGFFEPQQIGDFFQSLALWFHCWSDCLIRAAKRQGKFLENFLLTILCGSAKRILVRKKSIKADTRKYPKLEVGTSVSILKPNLWSGASGEVVSVTENGIHRVKIPSKYAGEFFHADVPGDQLEVTL